MHSSSAIGADLRHAVEPPAGAGNTYFGRFPASYWQRWTSASRIGVQASVKGEGVVSLVASDFDGRPRGVDSVRVQAGQAAIELHSELNQFLDGGALWLEIVTTDAPLEIGQVRWYTDLTPRDRGAAAVICRFNRPGDCVNTLKMLAADARCDDVVNDVYVVDQGTDTVASHNEFSSVEAQLGGRLKYLQQPNLGGAGGFTRGMVEVLRAGGETPNILLMDDDIMLEPETLLRLVAFANRTHEPAIVGGQMLRSLHPDELHVSAEYADLRELTAGLPVADTRYGAIQTEELQDLRVDTQYTAWWTCLLPPEVVTTAGLPMPMFFQWGFPVDTLPGAAVWHQDFAWKDADDWPRYFSVRNGLLVSALHSEFDLRAVGWSLFRELFREGQSVRRSYQAAVPQLTSDENWARLFGVTGS